MPKKSVKKKKSSKPTPKKPFLLPKNPSEVKVEKVLIENFVALQKVMTNLSSKFDNLANQISKLLELFEISAKALAEKGIDLGSDQKENKKILEKLNILSEQNRTLARGVALMHESSSEMPRPAQTQQRPMQRGSPPQRMPGYQRSMTLERGAPTNPEQRKFHKLPQG
ncbi:MAG: hypothetical protein KKF68_02305 [Nanoarchaeota archaeon]|nr:hypothetical protein [Nanoarchaeota archaeon]